MKFCPECGMRAEGFKFCPECGYKLTGGETAAVGAPKTDDIFGGAFGTDTFAKNDFFGGGIDDFDWGGAAQARTRDVEIQQEMDALSVFECEKHQNGKYAILSLKNAMEMSITVPACVEAIADGAFEGSDLLEVTLSEGLVKIGNRAFANCRELTKINFPRSLKFIGYEAFAYCASLDVEAPERTRVGKDAFKGTLPDQRKCKEAEEAERKYKAEIEKQCKEWYKAGERCYDNKDYTDAVKWFRKAAEQGYVEAQYWLGHCYYYGEGVDEDKTEAVKWYRKAAEQGYAEAQYRLGCCYYYGNGVDRDRDEAIKWYRKSVEGFRKAAEQGHAEAQYGLGCCYRWGRGVDEDKTKGIKWFLKAAEQGYAEAQYNLGFCYHWGEGVDKDKTEAVKWYRKAAEQGYVEAQYELGECYRWGRGVDEDEAEAVKWYRKAAEQGYAEAQCRLGDCYYWGFDAKQDKAEAVKWYRKAAAQGSSYAKDWLKEHKAEVDKY